MRKGGASEKKGTVLAADSRVQKKRAARDAVAPAASVAPAATSTVSGLEKSYVVRDANMGHQLADGNSS